MLRTPARVAYGLTVLGTLGVACSEDETTASPGPDAAVPGADAAGPGTDGGATDDAGTPNPDLRTSARAYYWGHSLVDFPGPAEDGTRGVDFNRRLGKWAVDIAQSAGFTMCWDGMYSSALAPTNFDGYDGEWIDQFGQNPDGTNDSCWGGDWASSDFDVAVIVENNFVRPPDPLAAAAAVDLLRRAGAAEPLITSRYLYVPWPEWRTYDQAGFDAWRNGDGAAYAVQLEDLLDDINAIDATLDVKLIPVNAAFVEIFGEGGPLDDFRFDEFAIDGAPHVTVSVHFLSGLVHYMTIFGRRPPASYEVPGEVDPRVATRFADVVDVAWAVVQANR